MVPSFHRRDVTIAAVADAAAAMISVPGETRLPPLPGAAIAATP
jgi:hypothetical protein